MEFLLVATAHFLALLSPGPDFFLILQAALRLPLRYAISVCAGIAAANGVYLIVAVLGLETVREMSGLMTVLQAARRRLLDIHWRPALARPTEAL